MSLLLVVIGLLVGTSSAAEKKDDPPDIDNTWTIKLRSIHEVVSKSGVDVFRHEARQPFTNPGIDESEYKVCGIMGAGATNKTYLVQNLFLQNKEGKHDPRFTSYKSGGLTFTYSTSKSWLALLMHNAPSSVNDNMSEASKMISDRSQTDAFLRQMVISLSDVVIITASAYDLFEQAHIKQIHTIVDKGDSKQKVELIVAHGVEENNDYKTAKCKAHVEDQCEERKALTAHGTAYDNLDSAKDLFIQKDGDTEITHYCYASVKYDKKHSRWFGTTPCAEENGKAMTAILKAMEIKVRIAKKEPFSEEIRKRFKDALLGVVKYGTAEEKVLSKDLSVTKEKGVNESEYVYQIKTTNSAPLSLMPVSSTRIADYYDIGSELAEGDTRIIKHTVEKGGRGAEKLKIELDTVGIEPQDIKITSRGQYYYLNTKAPAPPRNITRVIYEKVGKERDSSIILPIQSPWIYNSNDPASFRTDELTGITTVIAMKK
jgi:hypothetical protein